MSDPPPTDLPDPLRAMSAQERLAFCTEVVENLSDLIAGEAAEELCQRVEKILGDCPPYRAFRNTLEETICLLRECGTKSDEGVDEEGFRACVERVRRRLEAK